MRRARIFYFTVLPLVIIAVCSTCKNVDGVKPTSRSTFIKLYEKGSNFEAQVAEPLADGYLIGSNLSDNQDTTAFITKVDNYGNVLWEKSIDSSTVVSIKVLSDGYLIFGNGIKTNDTALSINDRVVTKALLTKIDLSGNIGISKALNDPSDPLTDFRSTGITIDNNGNILTTGNKKGSQSNAYYVSYVAVYNSSLDTLWTRQYPLIDKDNVNAKNVFNTPDGNILWTNSAQQVNLSQTLSYLTINVVVPKATQWNYSYFGQTITQNRLIAAEMQQSGTGYGIVGTFSDNQKKNANMFFLQVDATGNFVSSSLLFFDGVTGAVPSDAGSLNSTPASQTEDAGRALTGTLDGGYILGGTMTSTIKRGNGGLDIWLIKLDPFGNVLWNKIYGGIGNETVNSIRPLADGSFLVAGGSNNAGLTSAYIMRIDANGEVVN
jgi:hypothetical protein